MFTYYLVYLRQTVVLLDVKDRHSTVSGISHEESILPYGDAVSARESASHLPTRDLL